MGYIGTACFPPKQHSSATAGSHGAAQDVKARPIRAADAVDDDGIGDAALHLGESM